MCDISEAEAVESSDILYFLGALKTKLESYKQKIKIKKSYI